MRVLVLTALAVATVLVSGCATTMDDLQRGISAANSPAPKNALGVASTPAAIKSYEAFAERNTATFEASKKAMIPAGYHGVLSSTAAVNFRDVATNRKFGVATMKSWRIPVPQDAIDAESAELTPLLTAVGARMVEWNQTEPIELLAIADSAGGADYMASHLRRAAPGIRVTTKVAPGSDGYSGIELQMISRTLVREVGQAK